MRRLVSQVLKMEAEGRNRLNVVKQTQTSKWHNLVVLVLKACFRGPRFVVSRFVFATVLCISVKCIHAEFYVVWIFHFKWWVGGKDLSSWERTQFLYPPKPCFTHPKNWGEFTCLKQSIFVSVLLMQSIFGKHQKIFGLNDKSNREGFDTSPCLPVREKTVSRFHFQFHWCFSRMCQPFLFLSLRFVCA